MRQIIIFTLFFTLAVSPVFAQVQSPLPIPTQPRPGTFTDRTNLPHQAVVKIHTYELDKDFFLSRIGSGSGVIIDENGIVLTNYHEVADAQKSNPPKKSFWAKNTCDGTAPSTTFNESDWSGLNSK